MLKIIFFIFLVYPMTAYVEGLRCLACSLSASENNEAIDMSCVDNPLLVSSKITCPSHMKFCSTIRNDRADTGEFQSIIRSCIEDGRNYDAPSPTVITHYRACTENLCNTGKGLENPDINNPGRGDVGAMLVDGKSAASLTTISILTIFGSILLFLTNLAN